MFIGRLFRLVWRWTGFVGGSAVSIWWRALLAWLPTVLVWWRAGLVWWLVFGWEDACGWLPFLCGVFPVGWFDLGCAVLHLDVPGAVFDVAVVSVAEEDAVVGVGFTALGVGGDVVDFAPLGGGVAAGDDAAAVAGEDDAFLVAGEDSLGVA